MRQKALPSVFLGHSALSALHAMDAFIFVAKPFADEPPGAGPGGATALVVPATYN